MPLNITKPVWQERSPAGVALVGWKLRFKKINSDDDYVVYEDIQRTVPACQPAILNSEGWVCLYAGDGDYTVRVYDTSDVLKNCYDVQGAAMGGGGDGGFAVVPTDQAMRELAAGSVTFVITQGYSVYGDGCGGTFDWIPDSSHADDGVTWFAPVSFPAQGRYRLRNATALTMRMAGDPGNLDSSYETMTRLAAAAASGDNVVFPPGTYKLAGSQTVSFAAAVAVSAEGGAHIETADSSSVTILGMFSAPVQPVFTGELNVAFGAVQPMAFPEWFGGADTAPDNTDAFLALFNTGCRVIMLPGKNGYAVGTDISASIPADALIFVVSSLVYTIGPVTLINQGIYSKNGTLQFSQILVALAAITTLNVSGNTTIGGALSAASATITAALNAATLTASGSVTAGTTSGFLRARAGTGTNFLRSGGTLWRKTIPTGSIGASPTTLGSKAISANTLVNVGDKLIIFGTIAFANNANSKIINFSLTNGIETLSVSETSNFTALAMYFWASITRTSNTAVLFKYGNLVYQNSPPNGQLYMSYDGDTTSEVTFTEGPLAPNPHSHTVPAKRIQTLSTANAASQVFSSAIDLTAAFTGTGVANGDITLLDAEIVYDPAPESVD